MKLIKVQRSIINEFNTFNLFFMLFQLVSTSLLFPSPAVAQVSSYHQQMINHYQKLIKRYQKLITQGRNESNLRYQKLIQHYRHIIQNYQNSGSQNQIETLRHSDRHISQYAYDNYSHQNENSRLTLSTQIRPHDSYRENEIALLDYEILQHVLHESLNLQTQTSCSNNSLQDSRSMYSLSNSNSALGKYNNSEAELLNKYYTKRNSTRQKGEVINYVSFKNQNINISYLPTQITNIYTIKNKALANRIKAALNINSDTITQDEINELGRRGQDGDNECDDLHSTIIDNLTDENTISIKPYSLNPNFELRSRTPAQDNSIENIKSIVNKTISRLDNKARTKDYEGNKYYIDSENYLYGGLYLNKLWKTYDNQLEKAGSIRQGKYHQAEFSALLRAIEKDQEEDFINHLVKLATLFGGSSQNKIEKSAFIDAFTTLFVTKNFNSVGIRDTYLHFILQCGHIAGGESGPENER